VANVRHAALSPAFLMNSILCIKVPKPKSGIWKRMLEDLNRKGIGGVVEAVYATTLLQAVSR
jgi:hypothetical protein